MDMKKLMRQAQQMQNNINAAQEELATMENSAEAGGGMVKATVNGELELVSLDIKEDVLSMADAEMIQDLVVAAVNEAMRGMKEISESKMSMATGGLNIPGLS